MAKNPTVSAWYVNARWIFGILFFIIFSLTLFFYSLALVTGKERAVRAISTAAASAFSKKGMDDPVEVELLKRQVEASPSHETYPIAGLNITLTPKDFEVSRSRDVRINFFRKLATPMYENGVKGLETLADDPGMRAKLKDAFGFSFILSRENHIMFLTISVILSVLSVVLLALVIKFSNGRGRFLSAGISLSSVALPVIILFLSFEPIAHWMLDHGFTNYVAMFSFAYSAADIFKIYATPFVVGIFLVILFFAVGFKIRNSRV